MEINLKEIKFVIGWELDTESQICDICNGQLIYPPKNKEINFDYIIKNDKIIVGNCEHVYHESCLKEFDEPLCFKDSLIFKTDKIIETDMSSFV